jgi:hypothetical protein
MILWEADPVVTVMGTRNGYACYVPFAKATKAAGRKTWGRGKPGNLENLGTENLGTGSNAVTAYLLQQNERCCR